MMIRGLLMPQQLVDAGDAVVVGGDGMMRFPSPTEAGRIEFVSLSCAAALNEPVEITVAVMPWVDPGVIDRVRKI